MSHAKDPIPDWSAGSVLRCVDARRSPFLRLGATYKATSEPVFDTCLDAPAVYVEAVEAPHLRTELGGRWVPCWRFEVVEAPEQ